MSTDFQVNQRQNISFLSQQNIFYNQGGDDNGYYTDFDCCDKAGATNVNQGTNSCRKG